MFFTAENIFFHTYMPIKNSIFNQFSLIAFTEFFTKENNFINEFVIYYIVDSCGYFYSIIFVILNNCINNSISI
ncbi:hypothetical protein B6I99_25480 [Klebsiella quasipneumoniae]|nr:hypothetical protein KR75_27515 [Klebsiella variicola]PLF71072.1 hypothetical protein B6I99_25480 [Klebsiella quasipneumoniae]PXL71119.1 hypothetical protein DMS68_15795 [Klebsiella variicola]QAA72077.1 hypothetical protein D4N21_11415 [Klebsiella variicola]HBX9936362.1 hypothetical protein [Klebsiella variicola]